MTLKEALDLDFDVYLNWCYDYMNRASARDPMVADLWHGPHGSEFRVLLDAQWSRRYWFHKNSR